jgi:hypothetical protein
MATKMFYTLDEAKATLGKNEEEIKQYTREGRLREFRDGPRLMYKADQVEALKAELAGGDPVDIGASDSGMAIGLADSKGIGSGIGSGVGSGAGAGGGIGSGVGSGVGSGIGSGLTGSGSGLSLVDTDSNRAAGSAGSSAGGMSLKEDTALAADLGLSGSVGGVPSPASSRAPGAASGTGLSGSQGSRPGVDVFQNDEVERVDPSAQTAIAPGVGDMASEGVGSGSGLLDLTRESDDTSLGAELLDEIAPGGTAAGRRGIPDAGATGGGQKVVEIRGALSGGSASGRAPAVFAVEEESDPMAPAFGAAALGASLVVIFGAYALVSGILETGPDILQNVGKYGFIGVAGGGLVVTLLFFVVGLIIGKTTTR